MNHQPKYRWPLNKDQLEVLNLLYKFRFATSDLIAQFFGKPNGSHVYKRLKILQEQAFISKRYDNHSRIQGKPAAYYLLPNGVRRLNELRKSEGKAPINVGRLYKETRVTDGFVQYCLDVLDICLKLFADHGTKLNLLTKNQLAGKYDYFTDFLPGVYFRLEANEVEEDYFLEYLQSSKPFFAHKQRLKEYINYAESGEWEAATSSKSPKVLLVCDQPSLQKRVLKSLPGLTEEADDVEFYSAIKGEYVWRDITDPDITLATL